MSDIQGAMNLGAGLAGSMTEEHKATLNKHKPAFRDSMDPSSVMCRLRSMGVMTLKDQEDIEYGRGQSARADALVDFLLKKDDSVFDKLCTALVEENQRHLAVLLKPELKQQGLID